MAETEPDDAEKTKFTLGEEISGVHLNVVRALFPGLKTSNKAANVFAGQWRVTNLVNGEFEYATVDAAGLYTEDGAANPTEKYVKTGEGKVAKTDLEDNTTEAQQFTVSRSLSSRMLGDDSKIVFKTDGKLDELWIRVGDGKPN